MHKIQKKVTSNRPAYVGMCILDLSKTLMYDFHNNCIKQKYGDKAKLLFTDTDSLTYETKLKAFTKVSEKKRIKFDNSLFYDKTNNKVIGKFEDEAAGFVIKEFVGFISKISSKINNNQNSKTAKGI